MSAPAAPAPASPVPFNATRITNKLIVGGGLAGPQEVQWLVNQGVRALISAAAELDDTALAQGCGLPTLHVPWQDNGLAKPEEEFRRAYEWVVRQEAALFLSNVGFGVYIHCAAGVNRGPLLATYILARWSGLPGDAAWALIHGSRPETAAFSNPVYRQCCLDALSHEAATAFIPAGPLPVLAPAASGASDAQAATVEAEPATTIVLADSGRGRGK